MQEKFLEAFTEALELDERPALNSSLDDFADWDSLAMLTLSSLLDEQLSVNLTADDFNNAKTVEDLLNACRERKND